MSLFFRLILVVASASVLTPVLPARASAQDPPIIAQTPSDDWRRSQPARVTQRMGPTEMTVVYNRPVARGRALFGGLVPYDSLWNPGADEATRIEVDQDILVEGQRLPAGRYSIWAVPRPGEWTLVFSRAWEVQHRPFPAGQNALTLQIPARSASHMESLAFYFPVADTDSATLVLHWGETLVPISIRRP
jgi:hypothetical protein